jgi:hypothetical protein
LAKQQPILNSSTLFEQCFKNLYGNCKIKKQRIKFLQGQSIKILFENKKAQAVKI